VRLHVTLAKGVTGGTHSHNAERHLVAEMLVEQQHANLV